MAVYIDNQGNARIITPMNGKAFTYQEVAIALNIQLENINDTATLRYEIGENHIIFYNLSLINPLNEKATKYFEVQIYGSVLLIHHTQLDSNLHNIYMELATLLKRLPNDDYVQNAQLFDEIYLEHWFKFFKKTETLDKIKPIEFPKILKKPRAKKTKIDINTKHFQQLNDTFNQLTEVYDSLPDKFLQLGESTQVEISIVLFGMPLKLELSLDKLKNSKEIFNLSLFYDNVISTIQDEKKKLKFQKNGEFMDYKEFSLILRIKPQEQKEVLMNILKYYEQIEAYEKCLIIKKYIDTL